MALSNIFREPRREITESFIGIGLVSGVIYLDYKYALWLSTSTHLFNSADDFPTRISVGMVGGPLIVVLGVAALFVTHALGDTICNSLQRHGIRLRPKQRY